MSHQSFRRISPFLGGLIQRSQTEKMGNPFRGQTILGRFSATSMALRIVTLLPPAAGYPAVSPTKANRKKSMTIYLWNHGNRCISGLNWLNKPLTRCGKPSIETVAGCRQLMLQLEKLCWPAATGKTWDFGGHLWVCNFFGNLRYSTSTIPKKIVGFLKSKLQNNVSST